MSGSVWVVQESEYDSQYVLGVFKTRRAMLEALNERFSDVEIISDYNGLPIWAKVYGDSKCQYQYPRLLDLNRFNLDKWERT